MKTLIWIVTAAVIGLWSLLAWMAHGLLGVAGNLVASNTDMMPLEPELVAWASWLAAAGTDVGTWLVVTIWAIVSLLLLGMGFAASALAPRLRIS